MHRPQIQSAKVGPFLAVLGLLLAAWFSVPQTASAACLPQDHNDLFAATLSPGGHLENSSLPPENCVWENFENPNETTPADELNSLQLRWESHFGELENASGVLSYADGNPISLSDPFGLCASGASAFVNDGVINAGLGVAQFPFWVADQAHHILSGNWSSLGSGSYNSGVTDALGGLKNPYGNQGHYDANGIAPIVRDNAIAAAMIVSGVAPRGGGVAANTGGTVIGRVKDLQKLGAGEKSLLDQLPDLGSPKANWHQNSGVLRQEMNRGLPIRDASVGDTGGQFLNAERNLLQDRGWTFDGSYWNP